MSCTLLWQLLFPIALVQGQTKLRDQSLFLCCVVSEPPRMRKEDLERKRRCRDKLDEVKKVALCSLFGAHEWKQKRTPRTARCLKLKLGTSKLFLLRRQSMVSMCSSLIIILVELLYRNFTRWFPNDFPWFPVIFRDFLLLIFYI